MLPAFEIIGRISFVRIMFLTNNYNFCDTKLMSLADFV